MRKSVSYSLAASSENRPQALAARVAALAFLLFGGPVLADGGFFVKFVGQADKTISSVKQEALILRDGDKVQVTLRTHFRPGPPELAWVVPVPKKPEKVEKSDDVIFATLQHWTAPRFWAVGRTLHLRCGCGGGPAPKSIAGSVSVLESGTVGIFDYSVLAATGGDALAQWLRQNGYAMPTGAEEFIKPYVDQGWYWLAVQLRPDKNGERFLAPHPIRYTYRDAGKLVYPLTISRLSANEENEVVLYVLSNRRFKCENWSNFEVPEKDLTLDKSSSSGTNYEKLLRDAIRDQGGHAFATEFAKHTDTEDLRPLFPAVAGEDPSKRSFSRENTVFLTRLRTVVAPEAMDRDVILVSTAWAAVNNMHEIRVTVIGDDLLGAIATLAAISLMLLGIKIVRRWSRGA